MRSIGAAALLSFCFLSVASAQEFRGTIESGPLSAGDVPAALAHEPVQFRFDAPSSSIIFGRRLEGRTGDAGILVASADYFAVAALTDGVRYGGRGLAAGETAIVAPYAEAPAVAAFDVARFAQSMGGFDLDLLRADLDPAAERQRALLFWGALTPRRANLAASRPADVENARRAWLLAPAVSRLRFGGVGREGLREAVAAAADEAVRAGDAETLAALLTPAPYLDAANFVGVAPALAARFAAAEALIARGRAGGPGAADAPLDPQGGVNAGGLRLQFAPADDFAFVAPAAAAR